MRSRRWLFTLAMGAASCGGKKADDATVTEVEQARGELRRMQETGASPLNACRSRLQSALQKVGRGAAVETVSVSGSVLCVKESSFIDCKTVWDDRFKDVCGQAGYDQIKEPTSAPGDNKRFLADMAKAKAAYDAAVAAAATASPSAVYRERCWWAAETGDFKIEYKERATGVTHSYGTAVCQGELTTLGGALEPTATVVVQAKATATDDGKLEKTGAEIDRANDAALAQAAKQVHDGILAKVKP